MICVTLTGCTVDEMLKDAARATAVGADIVEVRLDKLWVVEQEIDATEKVKSDSDDNRKSVYTPPEFISQPMDSVNLESSLISFRTGIELPVILTCRPERQGGYFPGSEKERIESAFNFTKPTASSLRDATINSVPFFNPFGIEMSPGSNNGAP